MSKEGGGEGDRGGGRENCGRVGMEGSGRCEGERMNRLEVVVLVLAW